MNYLKLTTMLVAMLLVVFAIGCSSDDDATPSTLSGDVVEISGVYGTGSASADFRIGLAGTSEDVSDATVEVYEVDDSGNEVIVAGEDGKTKTESDGTFKIKAPNGKKNFMIKIKKQNKEKKCFMHREEGDSTDNTDNAVVDDESDVEAEMIMDEVKNGNTKPEDVDTEDVDEVIDGDVAEVIPTDADSRKCVIEFIRKARIMAQKMFMETFKDKDLSQDEVADIETKMKEAMNKIRELRKEMRKAIYDAIVENGSGKDAKIAEIMNNHREQVKAIIAESGIPEGLYLKARHIAQEAFEKAIMAAANNCSNFPDKLKYRIMKRALIRKATDDAMMTQHALKDAYKYAKSENVKNTLETFKAAVKGLNKDDDNREAIKNALETFHKALLEQIKAGVSDDLVTDEAIDNVVKAMIQKRVELDAALKAATTDAERKDAFVKFQKELILIVVVEFKLGPNDTNTPEQLKLKKILVDLIFSLNT